MDIKQVGIVGFGTMGRGIAHVCAQSGYQVIVSEISKELLDKGIASIDAFLSDGIKRGKVTPEQKATTLSRIKTTTEMQDFKNCDLVIEAVLEDFDLKKKVFTQLDNICKKEAILASNTSTMSIVSIAGATGRRERVVGLHFFNPVPLMKLIELVKPITADEEVLKTTKAFAESLGKTVVIAPDSPGFICNRLTMALYIQAIRMVERGDATPKDVDTALKLGRNFPAGPFEMMDNDLALILSGMNYTYSELQDPAYAPPLLLKKMVAAGLLGKKTGKGWYDYTKPQG